MKQLLISLTASLHRRATQSPFVRHFDVEHLWDEHFATAPIANLFEKQIKWSDSVILSRMSSGLTNVQSRWRATGDLPAGSTVNLLVQNQGKIASIILIVHGTWAKIKYNMELYMSLYCIGLSIRLKCTFGLGSVSKEELGFAYLKK